MTLMIDPERLKQIRQLRGFKTRESLAQKAGLDKQTIYRLERERKPIRRKNLERLAKALEVEPGVLTGEESIPEDSGSTAPPENDVNYQLNVRVDGLIRNAFSLAALHYKVPVRRIVELAPLLFVLAAEGSLKRRRDKLAELEASLDRASDQWSQIPHFPASAGEPSEQRQIMDAERESIAARDLFAEFEFGWKLEDRDDLYEDYDANKENPFALYLRECVGACDEAVIDEALISEFSGSCNGYSVCWSEAVDFASGDQRLAVAIHFGLVSIHEVLREFRLQDHLRGMQWTPEGARRRLEWMRRAVEPESDRLDRIMENPPGWMQERGVVQVPDKSMAIQLAGGDERLAEKIVDAHRSGRALWREVPESLWKEGAEAERVEWFRRILEPNITTVEG
jgi:transcriptional regulator with XRE-family HTH domain